jgi:hypothetical protein
MEFLPQVRACHIMGLWSHTAPILDVGGIAARCPYAGAVYGHKDDVAWLPLRIGTRK